MGEMPYSRPSELALNPDNDAARARRRAKLVEGLLMLSAEEAADLIEETERMVLKRGTIPTWDVSRARARALIAEIWQKAGLTDE